MSTIGERLRLAREQAGLSQGQVSRMMSVHRPTITEIEAGRRRVTAEEVATFSQIYDVSLEWLTGVQPNGESFDDRVLLAARELGKLSSEDLDRVLRLLATLKRKEDAEKDRG